MNFKPNIKTDCPIKLNKKVDISSFKQPFNCIGTQGY